MTETYSGAPRCEPCRMRAVLSHQDVERLVAASQGRLQAYRCPDGYGWHVWAPSFELRPVGDP